MKIERNGLTEDVFDFGEELGDLTFLGLKNESRDDNDYDVIKKRTYSVLSTAKQQVINIGVSAADQPSELSVARGTLVKLVYPVLGVMATPSETRYNAVELTEYINAYNIVPVNGTSAVPVKPSEKADKK